MKRFKGFIFALIVIFVVVSLSRNIVSYLQALKFYDAYKSEYEKEQKRNVELKTQILKKSDSFEIERTMRDKLSMSKPGEVVVILPQPTPTPQITPAASKPVYLQWFDVFFRN